MGKMNLNTEQKHITLNYRACLVLLLLFSVFLPVIADARSMPVRRVPLNDEMGLLDEQTAREVKRYSQLLYRDHKSELAILIIKTTSGQNHSDFALKVFNHWGLGQAGVNNGMLVLFAIDDRRVEIKPGTRYREHFNESFCTSLLTRFVVPEMRAGRSGQGVVAAAREVAAEIRRFEEGRGAAGSVSHRSSDLSAERGVGKTSNTVNRRQSSRLPSVGAGPVRLVIFAIVILIMLGGFYYFYQAYWNGRLVIPIWLFVVCVIVLAAIAIGLGQTIPDFWEGMLDQLMSGSGGASVILFLWGAYHICPGCNRYMMVSTRTLVYATYYSTGLGEKTIHCNNCGLHQVSTYTIPRRTRSSSSSGGGGGRSSGGGGGASW